MIDYEEDYLALLLFRVQGSLVPRAAWCAIPSCLITIGLLYWQDHDYARREAMGMFQLGGSQIWNATTAVLAILLSFRTRQGLMRFWQGTGLLHQMRGEWFDTVSNCVTFSISAKKKKPTETLHFRHTLVRLMSRCHGSALEEIAENSIELEAIDTYGLDASTIMHLKVCYEDHGFNKVEVMLHLVQSLITRAHEDGILNIPPPICSRVYQTISRGFVNLLNAKKITDTRFPFPLVQLIAFLLLSHTILTPLMMCSIIHSKIMAVVMTFVPVIGMFTLNFIAVELENPFGTDTNDLPMQHFQDEMNLCLLMLLHDNTDMIAGCSPQCIMDFDSLLSKMAKEHEDGNFGRLSAFGTKSFRRGSQMGRGMSSTKSSVFAGSCSSMTGSQFIGSMAPMAAVPLAPPPNPQAVLAKSVDDFEASLNQWMQSVGAQVSQLNQSFDALKAFNEKTSEMVQNITPHTPGLTPRTVPELAEWEAAISPM